MSGIATTNVLDVTTLPPGKKHPIIFDRFDLMVGGESLTIHNDHDPKPLYYQFLGHKGNVFTWEYLEEGPVWWKVRITKRPEEECDETLGQIAAKDLRKAEIFKKYGLDFSCGGKKTVKEVCAEKGLDVTKIEKELQAADKNPSTMSLAYNDWSIDFLIDHIINNHHSYVKKSIPKLREYAAKVRKANCSNHRELEFVYQHVEQLTTEMLVHMEKEEMVLFPRIRLLVANEKDATAKLSGRSPLVKDTIKFMESDHEIIGKALTGIRMMTNEYVLPLHACEDYGILYTLLEEFESDSNLHVHLENNILFPKALKMEREESGDPEHY